MNDFEISVCVKQKCQCGQVWEQTMLIKKDEAARLTLSSLPPSIREFSEIPKIPPVPLSLTGHVERLSVVGMDASGQSIRCSKCGEDLLYTGYGDIEGIGKVHPKEQKIVDYLEQSQYVRDVCSIYATQYDWIIDTKSLIVLSEDSIPKIIVRATVIIDNERQEFIVLAWGHEAHIVLTEEEYQRLISTPLPGQKTKE